MDEIVSNFWIQFGSLGVLTLSGWVVAYLINQERKSVQERRDALLDQVLSYMHEQKDLLQKIADGLTFQQVLKEELSKRDKQ